MLAWPPLSIPFAKSSGELSRISQVPPSCVSYWQGLQSAVQIQRSGLCRGNMLEVDVAAERAPIFMILCLLS